MFHTLFKDDFVGCYLFSSGGENKNSKRKGRDTILNATPSSGKKTCLYNIDVCIS